jgi:hypothetical protein
MYREGSMFNSYTTQNNKTAFFSCNYVRIRSAADVGDVTVRLSLNFILGVKIYTLYREDRVSGETCVTVYIAVRGIERGRMIQEQRE